jgi:hypothetical protein
MKSFLPAAAALALAASLSLAQPQQSKVAVRLSPLPERVATADAVVTGKVTGIEEKTVSAEPFAGARDKVEYQIAVIKIDKSLFGAKDLTHVKVGTVKPPEGKPPIRPGGYAPPRLAVDQEGLFFLHKHPTESFYVFQGPAAVVNKAGNDNFDKQLARATECAKLLADPKAGLKSKDAEERALTAVLLLARYTTARPGQTKREAIDGGESKQILTALIDGDWTKATTQDDMGAAWGFARLGLTQQDGWSPGVFANRDAYHDAAKAWLRGHAETYRVQRFVSEKKEEK